MVQNVRMVLDFRGYTQFKDVRIYDIIEENGKQKRVLNKRETTLANKSNKQ